MMQFMRDRVKIIYWVVILSFLLLMFLGWGVGDWKAPNRAKQDGTTVAIVNGDPISRSAWDQRSSAILRDMRARQGDTTSESDALRARDQAYNDLVLETIQKQESRRRGIRISDSEIDDMLQNDPPSYLLAQFTDADGNVDYDAYYQQLNSPTTDWARIRQQMKVVLPIQKLQEQITGEALVGESELRKGFDEQTARMVAEWVGVFYTDIETGDEELPESEVEAWYQDHLENFRQDEQSSVRLVAVPKEASASDEDEVLGILNEIRQDIVEGRIQFDEAARTYSEDTSASTGGDLGMFDRNRMDAPFTEAAFNLAVGDISEAVKTQFGYHLIECTDEKLDDSGKRVEVQARHILLKLHPSPATLDALRENVDAAREKATTLGIDEAASTAGFTVTNTPSFAEGMNLPGIPASLPASRFAFANDTGTLSEIFENDETIYFFEVGEKVPAGYSPLEEVRAIVVSSLKREHRADLAAKKLADALGTVSPSTDLASLAKAKGLAHAVTDTFGVRENIVDVGFASAFGRVAMSMKPGDFCPEVRTPRGVYALRLVYRSPFDEDAFRAQRARLATSMLYGRQQGVLQDWLSAQFKAAEVEDLRNPIQ